MCFSSSFWYFIVCYSLKEARGYKHFRKKLNFCFSLQILFITFCSYYFIIWYKKQSKKLIRIGPRWLLKCKHHLKSSKLSPFGGKMHFFGFKIEISLLTHRWPIFFNIISIYALLKLNYCEIWAISVINFFFYFDITFISPISSTERKNTFTKMYASFEGRFWAQMNGDPIFYFIFL